MIFVASLFILAPAASAASTAGKDVVVTSQYVKATALCSCGEHPYGNYYTAEFVNYCPICKSYGTLEFNPKGTAEGEWTCSKCNADYCAADGKEKMPGSNIFLTPFNSTNNTNNTKSINSTQVHAETVTESLQQTIKEQIALFNNKSFL
jgi:hypothetical protein